ncbi:MAG: AAA domain-containing protein [Candidatus Aminicenantes bacterium]|nr:AAA domain-containing protein [Candidatus Aminicenantes bacterium]NIM77839.1 AAA domain-containing protein [Candidatus Aminicenantes bacterium]NIN17151.1 AAA domain-containing protein [Candidatus Aminicenantes bacterium]NIN41044.1 AAA domain-containing protein [Candidatus Aminicenantes bacterium]NIN83849.1 AAA domain-containing protein [Candidatus Aminicenantes bacterium]
MDQDLSFINEKIQQESRIVENILTEIEKVIVGQRVLLERMMIAVLTSGHILLEGVPGLAKTLSIKTLGRTLNLKFSRIQFTPDLLPADLTGTMVFNPKSSDFYTRKGPIFTHLLLADEINRAPAKVQSALLEAMQELQVTIGENSHPIEKPFLVMATQNPIEQEGTYPLPEAQIDRFLLKVKITYPSKEEEKAIVDRVAASPEPDIQALCSREDVFRLNQSYKMVYIDEKIKDYIVNIVFATRFPEEAGLPKLKNLIQFGASPRASIYMTETAKALAFIRRRGYVTPEDVKNIGRDVLRHRLILSYEAEAEELTTDDIITEIFDNIEVP